MNSTSCLRALLLGSLFLSGAALGQPAVDPAPQKGGNQPLRTDHTRIEELLLKQLTAAHQRELDAAASELSNAQDRNSELLRQNEQLEFEVKRLRDQVEKWKTLASPNYVTNLARMKQRIEELDRITREEEDDLSNLERRHRYANAAMIRYNSRLSEGEKRLKAYSQMVQKHLSANGPTRSERSNSSNNAQDTSKVKWDQLRSYMNSLSEEIAAQQSACDERASEFKKLDETLKPARLKCERLREQRNLLEEKYDHALQSACEL